MPARINEIVRECRGITAETALRLTRYFVTDPHGWMTLQTLCELAVAERKLVNALASINPREDHCPTYPNQTPIHA